MKLSQSKLKSHLESYITLSGRFCIYCGAFPGDADSSAGTCYAFPNAADSSACHVIHFLDDAAALVKARLM